MLDPVLSGGGVVQAYHAPDGVTHALLFVKSRTVGPDGAALNVSRPAEVYLTLLTRFPDGGRVGTQSDPDAGFRRNRFGPHAVTRVCPGRHDPAELMAAHARRCRRYTADTGHAPLPALPFADLCRWLDELALEEKGLYERNPVTWADAFVMLMGYTRAAYRE